MILQRRQDTLRVATCATATIGYRTKIHVIRPLEMVIPIYGLTSVAHQETWAAAGVQQQPSPMQSSPSPSPVRKQQTIRFASGSSKRTSSRPTPTIMPRERNSDLQTHKSPLADSLVEQMLGASQYQFRWHGYQIGILNRVAWGVASISRSRTGNSVELLIQRTHTRSPLEQTVSRDDDRMTQSLVRPIGATLW